MRHDRINGTNGFKVNMHGLCNNISFNPKTAFKLDSEDVDHCLTFLYHQKEILMLLETKILPNCIFAELTSKRILEKRWTFTPQ